jgi:uncharacterized membrane protein
MTRNSGIGMIVFGIVLVAIGAIMRFAVHVQTTGFSIHTAGLIVLWLGVGLFIIGVLLTVLGARSRVITHESSVATSSGEDRITEQDSFNT